MRPFALAAPFTLIGSLALAAPATPEGAAALTATFQTYLGATPGVVSVQPEGESYGVKLDFSPLLLKLPGEGVEASVSPIEFKLTDNGDGTWGFSEDQALSLSLKVPGQIELSMHISHLAGTGTFDSALLAFSQSSGTLSDLSLTETVNDPAMGMTTISYQVDSVQYDSTSTANPVAGVDTTMRYQVSGMAETFAVPGLSPDGQPADIMATAASYTSDATVTGMRPQPIYQILAFFVANPTPEAINAGWPALHDLLGGALPVFDHLQANDQMRAIGVETPLGKFALEEMAIQIEANGLVADGMVREAFALKGLDLPEGLVPEWAAGLVPQALSLDLKVSGFDAASAALVALQMADEAQKGGMVEISQDAFLAALLPKGVVDLTLAPGAVAAPAYGLTYEGSMVAGPGAMPVGKASLSLTGLEAIREAVKAAPEDWGMQAAPVLAMAEAMARKGDGGALIWDIEATETGGFLVNGTDMAAMAGGQ